MAIDIVCSSTSKPAVISRALAKTLMISGWSSAACVGIHEETVASSEEMTRGEMYFSVHASTARTVARDSQSRHHALERVGRYLRQR